jgi:hypothetical protein
VVSGLFLLLAALASFGVGGYVTGRLRERWDPSANSDVVEFRDGTHGIVAWALAVVITGSLRWRLQSACHPRQRRRLLLQRQHKIQPLLNRRPKYRKLDRAIAEDGWQVVVLMRLSPIVPFNLQNYALGVTDIPFMQYLTATLIGIAPGIAI